MREEVIGDCRLLLGDCREVIESGLVADALITDPPYGVGFSGKTENDGRKSRGAYASFSDDDPQYIIDRVVLALSLCKRGVVTPGTRIMQRYPEWQDFGVFYIAGGVGKGRWGFCCAHPILYYGPRPKRLGMWPSSFNDVTAMPSSFEHPTAKPLVWMERLVSIGSLPGETVLDPFMGSGTTALACIKLGRRFVGIELEPKYHDLACRRIEAAYKQPDLFIARPSPAKQESLGL